MLPGEDSPVYVTVRTGAAKEDAEVTSQSVSDSSHKHPQPASPGTQEAAETGYGKDAGGSGAAVACSALSCCSTLSDVPSTPVCSGKPSSVKWRAHLPSASLAGSASSAQRNVLSVRGGRAAVTAVTRCGLYVTVWETALKKGCCHFLQLWTGRGGSTHVGGEGW